MQTEVEEYGCYLPQLCEVKAVVRHGVYEICGVKNSLKTLVTLHELGATTFTHRQSFTIYGWDQ